MRLFGLIGLPLSHSFSAQYFAEKFARENIADATYRLFPLDNLEVIPNLLKQQIDLQGFNVTIPYKVAILPYLNHISDEAAAIGAVNCVKIERIGSSVTLTGFNTDIYGFRESLLPLLNPSHTKALVLGTGGAAKAVCFVLGQLGIDFISISRKKKLKSDLSYADITEEVIRNHKLIINTTPLGMFPEVLNCPDIPYQHISGSHILYDLIYNPAETEFLKRGKDAGALTCNGLQMLVLQAEKSWEIWNK